MPEGRARRILKRAAGEAAIWYGIAGVFLAAYVGYLGAPAASIAPHLRIVTDCVLVLVATRLALGAAALPPRLLRLVSAVLLFSVLAALLLYYAVALVGLMSWGRVTSWDLIVANVTQAPMLLDAVGFSVPLVVLVLGIACAAMLWGTWLYCGRFDWVPLVASRASRPPLAVAAIGLLLAVTLDLHQLMILPPVQQQEPISLTLFPVGGAVQIESNAIDSAAAARRDHAEDAARASYRPDPGAIRRNVVVIVSDALRADHMGLYGYPRDTTPNMSRLNAAGMVRLAPAVHTACAESMCGLLSLASSRYLHQFSSRMFVLHAVLARNGYRIVMILGGDHAHSFGLKDQYGNVDSYFDASAADDYYMNDDRLVLDRLATLPEWDGKPVMIQLHLMSSHLLGTRRERSMAYLPAGNYFFPTNRMDGGKPSDKAINFYDNGVRESDAVIAEVLETLGKKGYLANTVVAVTADHGEGLGEHGLWAHQNSVYEEVLRVPFLLISYGYRPEGSLNAHPLPSQVDIAPTLLEELRMPRPESWVGEPLQQGKQGDFAYFQQGPRVGLLDRRDPRAQWKYWEDRAHATSFAFNLSSDPTESRNVVSQVPAALKNEWQLKMLPLRAQYVASPWKP